MRTLTNIRENLTTCLGLMMVLGTMAACGSSPAGHVMSRQSQALNENDFVASDQNRFFWHVEWLSGSPTATEQASARMSFQTPAGDEASTVVIREVKLIMSCCRESGAKEPQVATEAGMNPAECDVGDIVPTKSGKWLLRVSAEVNGAEADTGEWTFDVAAP